MNPDAASSYKSEYAVVIRDYELISRMLRIAVSSLLYPQTERAFFTIALGGQVCYFSTLPVDGIPHRRIMKKLLKPLLIGLAILSAAITVGILIYARLYLTPQMVENTLNMEIQEQLRRQVSFREIEVGLFKGIILRGVTVHKGPSWEKDDLLTCDEIAMSIGFLPLLLKKLAIRSLVVTNPRINLQSVSGRPVSLYGNAKPSAMTRPALELLVLPGSVMLSGGTVNWFDQTDNIGMQLSNVSLEADSISYILPFDIHASASFVGSDTPDIQLKGRCFIPAQNFSAELAVPYIDFSRFRAYLAELDMPLYKGVGSLNLTVKGSGDKPVQIACKASVKDAAFVLLPVQKSDDEIGLDGLAAAIEIQADYDQATDAVAIKKIQGTFLSSPFEGSATVRSAGGESSQQFHLSADRFSLDDLSAKLYYGPASPFKGLRLTGLLGIRMDMGGKPGSALFPTITLSLRANHIVYPALGSLQPELSGAITLDSRAITVSDVRIGTSAIGLVLAGTIANYLLWPPQVNLRLVSSDFNYNQLFNGSESQQGEDIGPFDFGSLKFDGPIELGNVSFMGLDLIGVAGAYFFDKNRFSIRDFTGGIQQGGSFNLSTSIDLALKGFDYSLALSLADVPVNNVAELAGIDVSQFIDGSVTGKVSVGGRGTKPATFADSLTGDAAVRIKNCRIKGFAMPEQLDRFIKRGELNSLSFTDADLQLKLRKAAIELSGAFISPKAELHPSGQVGFNAELKMQAQLKLATDVFSRDTKIADYLPREGSWVVLPVMIKGTLDTPSVTLTDEALRHIIQETLPRLFMDMLEKSRQDDAAGLESEDDRP